MPLLPASLIEPLWVEFAALIGAEQRPEFSPTHPWGCHRRRVPDRVVFDHLIAALVHGSGYERLASPGCSDRTIRRRLREWATAGHGPALLRLALAAFDRIIGLELADLSVDGAITKAPCGGEVAGRSPVDRGKHGLKRSTEVEGDGIPLPVVAARANRHDSPLLRPPCRRRQVGPLPDHPTMHLDRGYDSNPTRDLLQIRGCTATSPAKACQPRSRSANGGRWNDALVDERLRQDPPLHRPTQSHRLLPVPGRRTDRDPSPHPPCPDPLPVAHPPHCPTTPVTPFAGRS